jgi:hypothetical protein
VVQPSAAEVPDRGPPNEVKGPLLVVDWLNGGKQPPLCDVRIRACAPPADEAAPSEYPPEFA